MRSDRPYRAALAEARAVAELEEGSGRQFDPAVVEALVYVTATDDGLDAEVAAG
jgi:HD-GYP domain-containing protein (c-di-GMP phosphodiesterase class II)